MPGKSKTNNWNDIKMIITAVSVTLTLGLWNVFAATASRDKVAQAASLSAQPVAMVEPVAVQPVPMFEFIGKILLGGVAPQPRVIVRSGGGGGGGQPVTQTRSS